MKIDVELDGETRTLELVRENGRLRCAIDGRTLVADAIEAMPGTYSILIGGESFDVRTEPDGQALRIRIAGSEYLATVRDRRQWRHSGGVPGSGGRQQVAAPMPGKVVRVLVSAGDAVKAGQGLLVVEAMKMQNEVRSPKPGIVKRLLVTEGQTVRSGDALAIVE